MQENTVEGIVLRSLDYKEKQRIITLFTPLGVMSLIVKGVSSKHIDRLSLTTPFCHGQYYFFKRNSELYTFQDGVVLHNHLEFRQSLQFLHVAGLLSRGILYSQMPGKASETLFALYKAYHNKVSEFSNWQAFVGSFYIQILKLEGVLPLEELCESFRERGALSKFTTEDLQTVRALVGIQQFSLLKELIVSDTTWEKIEVLFGELLGINRLKKMRERGLEPLMRNPTTTSR